MKKRKRISFSLFFSSFSADLAQMAWQILFLLLFSSDQEALFHYYRQFWVYNMNLPASFLQQSVLGVFFSWHV